MTCNADTPEAGLDLCDADGCLTVMSARDVYAFAVINGMAVKCCSEPCLEALAAAERARVACTYGCGAATTPEDRVSVVNGGKAAFAHALCATRAANAIGFQLGATMARRSMSVVEGGKRVGMVRRTGPRFARRSS